MSLLSPARAGPGLARRGIAAVLLVSCGGCISTRHLAAERVSGRAFDPAAFFAGHTQGNAILKVALHRPSHIVVEGQGRVEADGTIRLDQTVQSGSGAAKHRSWRLQPQGSGRWSGTLSDAAGPVSGEVAGNCLHLAFAMRGGLKAQQWLYLQPGGTVARNIMVVYKSAIPVARLDETITRLP